MRIRYTGYNLLTYLRDSFSGRTLAFQACDVGSIPTSRTNNLTMKNNPILTETVLSLLREAVIKQKRINVSNKHRIIDTYDDASGQRGAYLSFFSYTSNGINIEEPHEHAPNIFFVRRKLTFTNPGDEGKEDAILLTIHGSNISKAENIEITDVGVIIDELEIKMFEY